MNRRATKTEPKKADKRNAKPAEKPKGAPPKKAKEVKVIRETRHLAVVLTAEEVKDRSDTMARLLDDIQSQESSLKSFSSTVKARVATLEGQLSTAKQEYQSRKTYRDIDCDQIHDFEEKIVRVVRKDTDEEIERREMTVSELQLPLPTGKPPTRDGTESMNCHPPTAKVDESLRDKLKEQATERLNDESDLTASALRARKRKQEALLDAVGEEAPKKRRGKVDVSEDPTGKAWDNDDEDGDGAETEDDEPSFHGDSVD